MATTIEQQVALDETLVASTKRLRIGRSNFRLPSDIQSNESTLQVVYDVLRSCPFFQAFLVTTDVPEIYMQEFWATAIVHHHSIRFKMNNKKHIINLETFRDMLHVCPRVPGQSFDELPFEAEILEFLSNTMDYKEYYSCATRVAAPKPKASARKKRGDSDTSITPPIATPTPITTIVPVPRITAAAKGKQPAKAKNEGTGSKAGVPNVPSDESEEKISWNSSDDEDVDAQDEGDKNDESDDGNDDDNDETVKDGSKRDEDDDDNDEEEEIAKIDEPEDTESGGDDEEVTKRSEDECNDKEDQDLRLSEEARIQEEEEADELYRDTDRLQDSFQRENEEFLRTIDENMKKIIKEQVKSQVKEQVSRILPRIKESVNATLETEVLTRSSHSSRTSYAVAADLSEMKLKKILIEKMEGNKSIHEDERMMIRKDPPLDLTGGLKDEEKEGSIHQLALHLKQLLGVQADLPQGLNLDSCLPPRRPPTPDRDWNKTLPTAQGNAQSWICELARKTDVYSSFNELLYTLIDFSNFIMNRLSVDTLTPELLASPTFELLRGLTELEYHLEEVYKATTDQLDWVNPEGQQYPHNLLQPLPLIPDNRGHRVIPFEHFINNDLEYLRGGASSHKYTTSLTKTKAADYGHIKWIEDLVPRAMWIQEPINYDRHALWGVSHWGRKRQQFYGFAVNREYALDVYSKRRIIAVTELKIVEWHNYKHLDWILVRRDDDKIYKFKEGDLKRLRLQDIEDMLLLLVQGKLSNLTRRVEDLQLGVESYQKRLNLTKPNTYRPDLKRREVYAAYSNPRGFIYQNKDKKNRLMRIDELQKFSNGTLNDVRNALDDRLKEIRMQYLPHTIWRRGDKYRAAAMIQAIDRMLKTRRIMRSLERFVGGRLYHFIKEQVEQGVIELYFVNTKYQLADLFTKALGRDRIEFLTNKLGMRSFTPETLKKCKSRIKRYIDTKPNHELIYYCLKNPPYKFTWADKVVPVSEGSPETKTERDKYDIYSIVDACPNACEMWKAIRRLKQEFLNQITTSCYQEQRKSNYQLSSTLVKQSQELKTVSYHKLYDILKQHQNEVNELRAERITRAANPLAHVSQQQPVYHPQNHPTHYTQNSSTRSQQAATRNRGKAIINSPLPIYDQEPFMVAEDDEMSKDKDIDKLMALISLSFKKIYKPTNNNLQTSSNTSRENQDNSSRINRGTGFENQMIGNVAGARETVAYHRETMLLCKQEEAGIQLNEEKVDWRDDTNDKSEDQELEAHYLYMAKIQEVSPDAADSGPIFNTEPMQKVPNNDNYNVFAIECEHPEQSKSVHDTYPIEQDEHNMIIDPLDISYDRE
nr:integrase, catalytic region, zinc finger, CCHC-type, peptidase aspartic, catalytic [Tanacetum cinerariifolium]